ncbi:helix-turn-helix domain-containing protein [Polaribacter sp. Hel1_33_78]
MTSANLSTLKFRKTKAIHFSTIATILEALVCSSADILKFMVN